MILNIKFLIFKMSHLNIFDYSKKEDVNVTKQPNNITLKTVFNNTYKQIFSDYPVYCIEKTELSCMNYTEMKKLAVCEITTETNKISTYNTPDDNRLGIYSDKTIGKQGQIKDETCGTCSQSKRTCPGHCGLIELSHHFINPLYIKYVKYILSSVCNECSELFLDEKTLNDINIFQYTGVTRLHKINTITAASTNVTCTNKKCGLKNFRRVYTDVIRVNKVGKKCKTIISNKNDNYIIKYTIGNHINEISVADIETIFNNISPKTLEILGFDKGNHPSNFIMKGLLVIPKNVRPPSIHDGNINLDHSTQMYDKIIKLNNKLKTPLSETTRSEYIRNLFFEISHFFNNKDSSCPSATGDPIKSITQRFCEKDGIIRGQAMGKRVDFFLRTVAGPGYACDFDSIRIPQSVKAILTTQIPVLKHNYNHIINNFYNTKKIIYLCRSIHIENNIFSKFERQPMKYGDPEFIPNKGDVIEVECQEDDYALINRQPSLHKNSIMGVKCKFWKNKNIGLHSSHTTPLNADFDGDELNLHKIQTIGSQIEARFLADVGSCIMNSQTNCPTMGLVFNCPNSAYLMSDPNVMLDSTDWDTGIKLLNDDKYISSLENRLKKHNIKMYSGNALFSTLLPPDLYYSSKNKEGVVKLLIKDGILIKGRLTKSHIATSTNSLIQILWKNYNKETTVRFFTEGQKLLDWFIEYHGFSIGYSSCVGTIDSEEINNLIDTEIYKIKFLINLLPKLGDNATYFQKEYNETQIRIYLGNLGSIGDTISSKYLSPSNDFLTMINSKAKGTAENIAKILGMLGQIFIYGNRPPLSLNQNTRCNVYCVQNSNNLKYRGFCKSSFMKGLDPLELFFHLMASRTGLIDTAIKTADVGSLHHRINKNFEDILIAYDGSVRNIAGKIYQFAYSDGFDASNLIPTESTKTGNLYNFINLDNIVNKLNNKYEKNISEKV